MSQAYHCLPTDLWVFDPRTPKGYYFNRGVYYFGRKVESEMDQAESRSRKGRTGVAADRLANSARLGVLSKLLGVEFKRYRDPGNSAASSSSSFKDNEEQGQDETILVEKGF